MKRRLILSAVLVGMFFINGCDSGYDEGFEDGVRFAQNDMTTLFLRDEEGYALADVPYVCETPWGEMTKEFLTAPDGAFSFYPGERCTFDFDGYLGTPEDPLFIEDDRGDGKEDIPYWCDGGDNGVTDPFGGFDYQSDDMCKFYF